MTSLGPTLFPLATQPNMARPTFNKSTTGSEVAALFSDHIRGKTSKFALLARLRVCCAPALVLSARRDERPRSPGLGEAERLIRFPNGFFVTEHGRME